MPLTTDILVVGAGPAGATVARLLALGGREVLLLEKERLPRHKPCGGGLPARTIQALGFDLQPVTQARITTVALDGAWSGRQLYDLTVCPDAASAATPTPALVVERSRFDAFLVAQAQAAGARVIEGSPSRQVQRAASGFTVQTDQECIDCRTLCICDGVASPTGRALGFPVNPTGFCLEATVPLRPELPADVRSRAVFNISCLQRGYAWAFPRGDEFAVGIGGAITKAPDLQARLREFVARTPELRGLPLRNLRGCFLPDFVSPRAHYARDGAYLLGDAAGLVDPLTGEGIFYAITSARLAATAILSGGGDAYEALLRRELLPELRIARHYAGHFHAVPRFLRAAAISLPPGRRHVSQFAALLLGNSTYSEMYRALHGGREFGAGSHAGV